MREWASECEARGHEHEDGRELHLDCGVKSVNLCIVCGFGIDFGR